MRNKTTAVPILLALLILSGCAPQPADERAAVDYTETHEAANAFADTVDISSAVTIGLKTTLVADPAVLTVSEPEHPGDATFELIDEQCSLRLVQVASSAVGVTFTHDDFENSVLVTMVFHGVESPIQRPEMTWSVNEGEGALGAQSSLFAGEDGRQTLTVSRGVGSISQLFYSELSCAPGVDVVEVYTRSVMPRVWIVAE